MTLPVMANGIRLDTWPLPAQILNAYSVNQPVGCLEKIVAHASHLSCLTGDALRKACWRWHLGSNDNHNLPTRRR